MPVVHVLRLILFVLLFGLTSLQSASAQKSDVAFLRLEGTIEPNGEAVTLNWPPAKGDKAGVPVVSRRELGEEGVETWRVVAPNLGRRLTFRDTSTRAGVAYEYRVHRQDIRSGEMLEAGYWATGVEVPPVDQRGIALMVVDETVSEPLAPHLDRFEMDLIGDGWRVRRLATPRGRPQDPVADLWAARELKARIKELYWEEPDVEHALILVGHVPLPRSGHSAPDGHKPVPHGTDTFYADMDGAWVDDGNGVLRNNFVPGGRLHMMVGRIDFSDQTGKWTSSEADLLRSYFDKNHAWRQGLRGNPRNAYGKTGHLEGEIDALFNIVGPDAVVKGGHHGVGQSQPWLLGVDFGDWSGKSYRERYSNKAYFAINFGSQKQKIGTRGNAMNALLAQPWYPLSVGWGARPTWRLHYMALGYPMGYSHRRTVNNGVPRERYPETMEYLPTGQYVWRNPVWVNLLGDPTVRPFPVAPARNLVAEPVETGTRLTWTPSASESVYAYRVFRATSRTGDYMPIDGGNPVGSTEFTDADPISGAWYMVRALGLVDVHAGSFHSLSQGRFAQVGAQLVEAPDRHHTVAPGETVRILPLKNAPDSPSGTVFAPVVEAANASLTRVGDSWTLEPMAGFAGDIRARYMASDGLSVNAGTITVTVGDR